MLFMCFSLPDALPEVLKLKNFANSRNHTVCTPVKHEDSAPRAESVPEKHIIIMDSHI